MNAAANMVWINGQKSYLVVEKKFAKQLAWYLVIGVSTKRVTQIMRTIRRGHVSMHACAYCTNEHLSIDLNIHIYRS